MRKNVFGASMGIERAIAVASDPTKNPADIAVFSISCKSNYLVAQNIVIDGGFIESVQEKTSGRPVTNG